MAPATSVFAYALVSIMTVSCSQAAAAAAAQGAGGPRLDPSAGTDSTPGGNSNNYYCTPYEWQTNPQECVQRTSLYTYNLANAYNPQQYSIPSFDNYLQNFRANFDNWQQNFQSQLQQNLLQMQQRFADLEGQIRAQAEYNRMHGGGGNSFHSSTSSFNGDSSGASETVMSSSNNDGSWTIRANGLGVSSASNGDQLTLSTYIGDEDLYESKIINDKEMLIEVIRKDDPRKRWMSIQITAGKLRVQDFQVTRPQPDTLLVQSIPSSQPPPHATG